VTGIRTCGKFVLGRNGPGSVYALVVSVIPLSSLIDKCFHGHSMRVYKFQFNSKYIDGPNSSSSFVHLKFDYR